MAVILLVVGDDNLRQAGRDYLSGRGHSVVGAASAAEGLRTLRHLLPDLIIFNTDVTDMAMDEFQYWLLADPQNEATPIIYLVPPGLRELAEAALTEAGKGRSVVLGKPFRWHEVEEEVRRALADTDQDPPDNHRVRRAGDLALNQGSYELKADQDSVLLTPLEFRLTDYLMQRANTLVGVEELLVQVWGYHPNTGSPEVVRAHIRNLRHKMGRVLPGQEVIQTVPRRGYRMVAASKTSM